MTTHITGNDVVFVLKMYNDPKDNPPTSVQATLKFDVQIKENLSSSGNSSYTLTFNDQVNTYFYYYTVEQGSSTSKKTININSGGSGYTQTLDSNNTKIEMHIGYQGIYCTGFLQCNLTGPIYPYDLAVLTITLQSDGSINFTFEPVKSTVKTYYGLPTIGEMVVAVVTSPTSAVYAPVVPFQSCGGGSTGQYPNCTCPIGYIYSQSANTCVVMNTPCPSNATNASTSYAPECQCPNNYVYDVNSNTCKKCTPCSSISGTTADPNECVETGCTCSNQYAVWSSSQKACVVPACPNGSTGNYPNCKCTGCADQYNETTNTCDNQFAQIGCPSGATGTPPNCTCPNGNYDICTNTCPSAITCGMYGLTGNYPNCNCPNGYFDQSTNKCTSTPPQQSCPSGATGTYPNCVCTSGSYDPTTNTCQYSPNPNPTPQNTPWYENWMLWAGVGVGFFIIALFFIMRKD